MLQKILLIILLSCFTQAGIAQSLDCYPFKEGKFRISDTRIGGIIIAERKGGFQTESMETLKAVVRFRINWQNDCSYTLTLDKVIRNENKLSFPPGMTVNVKIIASNNNTSFTQETSSSVTNGTYRTEVTKIQ